MLNSTGAPTERVVTAFIGRRLEEPIGATVFQIIAGAEHALPTRLDLRNHSPNGFEWGYSGSGPAQTALAMCAAVSDDATALRVYQAVKARLIATLPQECSEWTITAEAVRAEIRTALATQTRD